MPCTVGGICIDASGLVSFTAPLRGNTPWSNSARTISSMKNGLPSVLATITSLTPCTSSASPTSSESISAAFLAPERIEPQLSVIGLITPVMRVFRAVVDHHQDMRGADAVGEKLEQRLGLSINPV